MQAWSLRFGGAFPILPRVLGLGLTGRIPDSLGMFGGVSIFLSRTYGEE